MTEFTSRRSALSMGALALGLPAAAGLGLPLVGEAAAQTYPLDLKKKSDFHIAVQKMRGALDDRVCMGGITGLYYGVVDGVLIPLYGVLAGTFSRYVKLPDGNYEGRSFEIAYFTDWDTGDLIDKFKNPFTGETVDVPQTRMGPSKILITADGFRPLAATSERSGMVFNNRFLPARVVNNDVWIVDETRVSTPPDFKGPKFLYNEVTTLHTTLTELNDPNLKQTPTLVHFNLLVGWRPWLKMGDRPGHLLGNGTGRRYSKLTDYPPKYQEYCKKFHADAWADPAAILAKI